jgi:hypothetical protein
LALFPFFPLTRVCGMLQPHPVARSPVGNVPAGFLILA